MARSPSRTCARSPNSSSARARASAGGSPRATRSSTRSSRWKRSSSSTSRSTFGPQNDSFIGSALRRRRHRPHDLPHRGDVALPALALLAQRAAALGGEAIELGALPLLRGPPLGLHPLALLHPVQRRVERAVEDAE